MYRDYNIASEVANLSSAQNAAKKDIFCTYAAHDSLVGDCHSYGDGGGAWHARRIASVSMKFASVHLQGHQNLCLSPEGNVAVNETLAVLSSCSTSVNQIWTMADDGTFRIKDSTICLTRSSDQLRLKDCRATDSNQKWTLTNDGMLRTQESKCLTARGASLTVEECRGTNDDELVAEQTWIPTSTATLPPSPGEVGAPAQVDQTVMSFTGSWDTWLPQPALFRGDSKGSKTAGSMASYTFTGTGVTWIGQVDSNFGRATVAVDGVRKATVDSYSSTNKSQQSLYEITGLEPGIHTMTITVLGSHNPSSSDSYVEVDALVIHP